MSKVFYFLFTTVVVMLVVQIIAGPLTDSITERKELSAAAGTSQTLPSPSWYSDTTGITVEGTTAKSLADRTTLTLAAAASANDKITYIGEKGDDQFSIIIKIIPFLLLLGGIGSATAALVTGGRAGIGGGLGMGVMEAGIVVLVGVIMLPIINAFANNVAETYSVMPEYMAIGILIPLVKVAYLLGLLAAAFGSFGPQLKGAIGNRLGGLG